MKSVFEIRGYATSDWGAISRIYNEAKPFELKASGFAGSPAPLQDDQKRIDNFIEQKIYVCQGSQGILGFAGFKENYIGWLFVDPKHVRQGVARSLLKAMIAEINGTPWLYVMKNHLVALNLYTSEGFSIVEEIQTANGLKLRLVKTS